MSKINLAIPKMAWEKLSKKRNWIDYVLPKRTDDEFWREGADEAENIKQYMTDNSFVIDYGCGIGRITKPFKKYCKKIVGLDICSKFIEKAGKDVYDIDSYDKENVATFIFCISVIQHNKPDDRINIVKNIHSLLKKGGKCFINFPVKGEVYKGTSFVHTFNRAEIENLLKDFSKIELIDGNLTKYDSKEKTGFNEIFAIATK